MKNKLAKGMIKCFNDLVITFFIFTSLFLFLTQCNRKPAERDKNPEIITSSWHFDSEPSSINISDDGRKVLIGTEDGYLFVMENENIRKTLVFKGERIFQTNFLGEQKGIELYLISVRYFGIHIIGIDKNNKVVYNIPLEMEKDAMPFKGNRYTAYDWAKNDSEYYFATSNGIWTCTLSAKDLNNFTKPIMLKRIGEMGKNQMQYSISAICRLENKLYYSAQDGVWCFDGKNAKRVISDKAKYDCVVQYKNNITAINGLQLVEIDKKGKINVLSNEKHRIKFKIQINDTTHYDFADGRLYINNNEEFELPLTQYTKNAFAVNKYNGNPVGIYMINGNEVEYIDVKLASMFNRTLVLGACEDKKDNTAYMIDKNWDLYHISDMESKRVGYIEGMRTEITDMIVMNDEIYAVSLYSLYKIPTKPSFISNTINAEKIEIFKGKSSVDTQMERMARLYNQDREKTLIIATRSHIWSFDISKKVSAENPLKLCIKASISDLDKQLYDLDSIYEPCNVQTIARYPNKNSSDLFVGTRDFGILSFDKNVLNMLVPETWLGLNARRIRNIKAIDDRMVGKDSDNIKILVAGNDSIYLVTFHPGSKSTISALQYSAKNLAFIDGHSAFAIDEMGGYSFFDITTDRISLIKKYYSRLHFKQNIIRLKDNIIVNSSVGLYLIDKQTHKLNILDFSPKTSGWWNDIFICLVGLISLFFIYYLYMIVKRIRKYKSIKVQLDEKERIVLGRVINHTTLSLIYKQLKSGKKEVMLVELIRRSQKILNWWNNIYQDNNSIFNTRISELLDRINYVSFNFDDEYYSLKNDYGKFVAYRDAIDKLEKKYHDVTDKQLQIDVIIDYNKTQTRSEDGVVKLDLLVKRMTNLEEWLQTATVYNIESKESIVELISNRMLSHYDFSEKLKMLQISVQKYGLIKRLYDLLPADMRSGIDNQHTMVNEIIAVMKIMQMEVSWLNNAVRSYNYLIMNEQKIAKLNHNLWLQILDEKRDNKEIFNNNMKNEILSILDMHHDSDYSMPLFNGCTTISMSCFSLPDNWNEYNEEYLIHYYDVVSNAIFRYYQGLRNDMIQTLKGGKMQIEDSLRISYLKIVSMGHQKLSLRSKLIDYFKNILTYLYYHLFVINNNHVFAYNDKEHKYDTFYDFQQQIIMLCTILGDEEENVKYDMRPSVLTDKLYLTIEGNDSTENSISKFKDKTKTLHTSFYKNSSWKEYPQFVSLLFDVYIPLEKLYGTRPKKMLK